MSKPRLAVSFSGGRTSAVMTKLCIEQFSATHEIVVTFANTGCEHENTLRFVRDCDEKWHFNTVWLEAVVNPEKGKGIRHKIVTFETASRNGEPFEAFIAKAGLPNATSPVCSSRLKEDVINSYIRSLGWKRGTYKVAIGIRADEVDRISETASLRGIVYPLVKAGYTKEDVVAVMKMVNFDLRLPGEHYGNCVWCWKKSLRKLLTVAKHTPQAFDFPKRMEEKYGHIKAPESGRRVFFRNHLSAADILKMAQETPFKEYSDSTEFQGSLFKPLDDLDIGSGCSESCEIGADHN